MEFVLESLRADWQAFLLFSPKLIYALVLVYLFFIAGRLLGKVAANVMRRSERLRSNERFVERIVVWAIRLMGVLLALGVIGLKGVAASLLATGGVMAIVLGFAFREVGENLLAGLFLAFSRPFERGDLIKTGDLTGTVRSIDIRSVHLRTADACDVFVPSSEIFSQALFNYTRDGMRRPSFTIGVAYNDEPERVMSLLEEAAAAITDVLDSPRPMVTVDAFDANYIVYEVFFWMNANETDRGIVAISNDVKVNCWRALRDAGVTFSTDVTTGIDIKTVPELKLAPVEPESFG